MNNNGEGLTPLEARQGEDVVRAAVPDRGAVEVIMARHDDLVIMYGGEPWDESCVEDGERAHMDRGELLAIIAALETENAQHAHQTECMRQERRGRDQTIATLIKDRDELVLALMWCRPRLKHQAYISHVDWTLTKYPKPSKLDEPRIVRSEQPSECATCGLSLADVGVQQWCDEPVCALGMPLRGSPE